MSSLLLLAVAFVVALLAVVAIVAVRRRRSRPPPATAAAPERPPAVAPGGKETLGARVHSLLGGRSASEVDWEALTDVLLRADVGPGAARSIVGRIRERYAPGADAEGLLVEEIAAALGTTAALDLAPGRLSIVLMVGVNGCGKTTTIGKLAAHLTRSGRAVTLAGTDTFRAAAVEQLGTWAERAGVQMVSQERGADPGAVVFDAVQSARARGSDVLIVDTAGRLQTRTPLMDELKKLKRVVEKAEGILDETLLVLDATTGQNGVAQARAFTDAVEVTGVVLTKMDGTAKGGIVLAVREELGVPVKLVGTGEGIEDLEAFDPTAFAERLVRG